MRFGRITLFSALLITSVSSAIASPHLRRGPTSPHLFGKRATPRPVKPVSQRVIDPERTTQIQTALIKQGYMTGEPTGKWDAGTQSALEKMQGDNGWQTKLVPDSRAIIKLGLGPGSTPPTETATATASASGSMGSGSGGSQAENTFPAQK